jgi:hypothetical protein
VPGKVCTVVPESGSRSSRMLRAYRLDVAGRRTRCTGIRRQDRHSLDARRHRRRDRRDPAPGDGRSRGRRTQALLLTASRDPALPLRQDGVPMVRLGGVPANATLRLPSRSAWSRHCRRRECRGGRPGGHHADGHYGRDRVPCWPPASSGSSCYSSRSLPGDRPW